MSAAQSVGESNLESGEGHVGGCNETSDRNAGVNSVLSLRDVTVTFHSGSNSVTAIMNVDLDVSAGEVIALVGESGSGKSTLALACAGLLAKTASLKGSIKLNGHEICGASEPKLRELRGSCVGFVFQDPLTSLNPLLTIGTQVAEVATTHLKMGHRAAVNRAKELLNDVRIVDADQKIKSYPHQFSGGMRQRVLLASALAGNPQLLIADEPTTALDVTVQAEILELLRDLCKQRNLGVVFITHNLGVAAAISDRVAVLYAGEVVEIGRTKDVFDRPHMPYTTALLESHPSRAVRAGEFLSTIPGEPPLPGSINKGCRFAGRCSHRRDVCESKHPPLSSRDQGKRFARCWGTEPDRGWIE